MYNPFSGQYNGFSPYGYPTPSVTPQQPTLPQQQVLQANGKASVDAIRMTPNSSVLVLDTTAPIVWLCTSDGLGTVTAKPYDISEHKDAAPVPADDVAAISERLAAVEKKLEEVLKHESDTRNAEHGKAAGAGV